jgi:predicted nucleotidyltransferase
MTRQEYLRGELPALCQFFENDPRVLLALVFGSLGTPHMHFASDIDIAVLLDEDISLMEELALSAELSILLGRDDIDLTMLRHAPVNVAHRALATGDIIYSRDPAPVAEFVEKTLNQYLDFGLRLQQMDRDFDLGLKEEHGSSDRQ